MTAAKSNGRYIKALPGCAGQAADPVPASSQNGRCTNVIQKSEIGMSRYLDTSTQGIYTVIL